MQCAAYQITDSSWTHLKQCGHDKIKLNEILNWKDPTHLLNITDIPPVTGRLYFKSRAHTMHIDA